MRFSAQLTSRLKQMHPYDRVDTVDPSLQILQAGPFARPYAACTWIDRAHMGCSTNYIRVTVAHCKGNDRSTSHIANTWNEYGDERTYLTLSNDSELLGFHQRYLQYAVTGVGCGRSLEK